ncbi:MAG TPA: hypothetical protein VMM37_03180, partial [Bacteroidota bacterium]|nr:hypothetical protein [Bacteroidota bacterium]
MKIARLFVGILCCLVLAAFFRLSWMSSSGDRSRSMLLPPANERDEDPVARAHQEWMQLRDPATNRIPDNVRSRELSYAKLLPNREAVPRSGLLKGEVLTWSSRGPYNQGGRTRALAYDLSDATGNTILAGGVSGGMWRSTDGGASWTRTSSLADSIQSVSCLV